MTAMSTPVTVHLVDASPYIFRAFFSLPTSIVDPSGRPLNAVHGFAGFLRRLIGEESPTHLGLAFDGSLTTSFRNEIYPEYKAQRALPPPELEAQLDDCRLLGAALGAATFIDSKFEADDLIGTLVDRLVPEGHRVVVVSSDKDLAQLVGDRCELLDFARGVRYGPAEVEERFAVRPEQMVDLLALAGDRVDNIPGVRGVGAKTAAVLLAHFGSLESLYERLEEVESLALRGTRSLRRRLETQRDWAFLSKRLAQIATEAPLSVEVEQLALRGANVAQIEGLLGRGDSPK